MNIKMVGIPSNAGALYSGTETMPAALRRAGFTELLKSEGIDIKDVGDVLLPSYMPRHNVSPIRNWPSPRIVWEEIEKSSQEWFGDNEFMLILGGDCSIVTGTVSGLYDLYEDKTYLISLDAHLDAVMPSSDKCIGAAAMGLWFLCNNNLFFNKPQKFNGTHINVLGTQYEYENAYDISLHKLDMLRQYGLSKTALTILSNLPQDAKILIHLDLDVINRQELHAVYSPSDTGLSFDESKEILETILSDRRVVGIEVAEFSGIHDRDGSQAVKLARLLCEILKIRV